MSALRRMLIVLCAMLPGCGIAQMGPCEKQATPPGKLPLLLQQILSQQILSQQIQAGRAAVERPDICAIWEQLILGNDVGYVPAPPDAPVQEWQVIFRPDVMQCKDGSCKVPAFGDVQLKVKRSIPSLNLAVGTLEPELLAPLLKDERVQSIAPSCPVVIFPVEPEQEIEPLAEPQGLEVRNPGCDADNSRSWGLSDGCVPMNVDHARWKTIAVLDSGVDCQHPALQGRIAGNKPVDDDRRCNVDVGKNYVYDDDMPPDNCDDSSPPHCESHGTAVSGIALASSEDLYGVDPEATLLPVKILKSSHDGRTAPPDKLAQALLDSERDADVLNISANWYDNDPGIAAAIDALSARQKVLVVASARAKQTAPAKPAFPAAYATCSNSVIGVGDVLYKADTGKYLWGSRTDPDEIYMVAPGTKIRTAVSNNERVGYGTFSGSSFAAPHVSGAASLVWSTDEFAKCTPNGIRDVLWCSARDTSVGDQVLETRKRLHLGCLFGQKDSPLCRPARHCINEAVRQHCR